LICLLLLQVVRSHLATLRKKLVAEREAYADALLRYQRRLQLEQHKARALREAGAEGVAGVCFNGL
jgi:hypothetical protein